VLVKERSHEFKLSVPAEPLSLGIVRRAVQGLEESCGEEVATRLAVIYSELVTNAIRHSGIRPTDRVEVIIEVSPERIHGSVVDAGHGFDPAHIPDRPPEQGGFGLRIVEGMASRWGVNRNGAGRTQVWFDL
jgi:anti-sigma regulatory factor (Ser/Thr protein kinase)